MESLAKMIAPLINELAEEYEGKLTVAKMDIDSNRQTPMNYNIRGIPLLVAFRGGRELRRQAGVMQAAAIVDWASAEAKA